MIAMKIMLRNLNSFLIPSFFLLCISSLQANSTQLISISNPVKEIGCSLINCGEGTCKGSNKSSIFGFECECNKGWKKLQIGPLSFPSCVIPNCTMDFSCGNGSAPLPPSPAPRLPPGLNFTDPCALIWCGDGTCATNGTGHTCECNEGSANLLNMTGLACFRECSFGADCDNLGFGIPTAPPPPSSSPSEASRSSANGLIQQSECSRNLGFLTMAVVAITILAWI